MCIEMPKKGTTYLQELGNIFFTLPCFFPQEKWGWTGMTYGGGREGRGGVATSFLFPLPRNFDAGATPTQVSKDFFSSFTELTHPRALCSRTHYFFRDTKCTFA